jgi:hypothetical protein
MSRAAWGAMSLCAVAFVAVAATAAPARADTLTFIKSHNVWLANPDGSGQHQVTFDGTAAAPYESPSQADGGAVVAIREAPGQRRQIYRMTQSGRLLNAPIDTPAPGTGALNAKVSPNGALVAYWFETLVNDPLCVFCVSISNRALFTYSDRFTSHDAIGTPNTGGWPSWIGNDTIALGNGGATQWYYGLGMSAAEAWFTDFLFTQGQAGTQTLLDAEVAPTEDRVAVVRGNHQETIRFLEMNGPPPAAVTPILGCWYQNPSGKFVDPTWTSDGDQLAWQEDDGVWLGEPGDLSCPLPEPALIIPGASQPDLSPAAINPGPRPPCGNPGNPTCPPPQPPPVCGTCPGPNLVIDTAAVRRSLRNFVKKARRGFARLKIGGLLRKRRLTIEFKAPAAGRLSARLTATGAPSRRATTIASGRRVYRAPGNAKFAITLTAEGAKSLRRVRRLRTTLRVSFTPNGAGAISTTSNVRLKR